MEGKQTETVLFFQTWYIILTLLIYVTLFTSPENTLGSELCLLFSQAQEEGFTHILLFRF